MVPYYKLDTCGIIPILLAWGRRSRVLLISDRDAVTVGSYSWDGWWYHAFAPGAPIVGWYGPGDIDVASTSPMLAETVTSANWTLGSSLLPFYRPGQGPGAARAEGYFYDTASPGTGNAGVQGDWLTGPATEVVWPASSPPADNQTLFQFSLDKNDEFGVTWGEDALTAVFVWHQPAADASGSSPIDGGPTFNLGYARGFDAATTVVTVANGATSRLRSAKIAAASGAGYPSITISQPAGSGANDNLKRRMVPCGCLLESATAAQGLTLIPMAAPYTSPYDWSGAGSRRVAANDLSGTRWVISEIVDQGIAIDAAIVRLTAWMTADTDPRGLYFEDSTDYQDILAGNQAPPGHYIESFEDDEDAINGQMSPTRSSVDRRPFLFLMSHFSGYGTTLAEAALILQRMETEFVNALDYSPGHPLYTKYGLKEKAGYFNAWWNVSPATILTGQGSEQYIRLNGTGFHASGETWASGRTYTAGMVVCRAAAPLLHLGNAGWYVCATGHTSAASGVSGPPGDVASNKWTPVNFALNDNGMRHEVEALSSAVRTIPDASVGGYRGRNRARVRRVV